MDFAILYFEIGLGIGIVLLLGWTWLVRTDAGFRKRLQNDGTLTIVGVTFLSIVFWPFLIIPLVWQLGWIEGKKRGK